MLEAKNFITGYNQVEGFVSLMHAFKVELGKERNGEMMVLETDFYHCQICGIIPRESGSKDWRRFSCPNHSR